MASNVLPLFWQLSSNDKKARLDASEELVSALQTFQKQHEAKQGSSSGPALDDDADMDSGDDDEDEDEDGDESGVEVDEDDDMDAQPKRTREMDEEDAEMARLDRIFEAANSSDVQYSIKRLIRGLSSSRENSRFGFAVALTELLATIDTISPRHMISLIVRGSQTSNAMKGTEERDNLFARLFGLTAVVESGVLFQAKASMEDFKICFGELMALGEKKSWIRESAWWTVLTGVKTLLASDVSWREDAVKALLQRMYGTTGEKEDESSKKHRGMEWTQEKAALTLVLQDTRPDLNWKVLLSPTFRNASLLSGQNLSTLGKLLKETNDPIDNSTPSGAPVTQTLTTGSWKPQVHFIWDIIMETYFTRDGKSANLKDKASFQEFYRITVDETLFAPTSTPQRKYWGFEVVSKALPLLSDEMLPMIFTQNFMKCWMNHLSGEDRYLHKAAQRIAKQVQDVTKTNSLVGFALLSQLLGKNGSRNFDKVTKTKTVENIMGNLNKDGVQQYIDFLTKLVLETAEADEIDGSSVDTRRAWAFDQFLALIRSPTLPKEDAWVSSVLEFLLTHGLFVVDKSNKKSKHSVLHVRPQPPLSEASTSVCRARFFSAIIELTVQSKILKEEERSTKLQSCDSQGKLWLTRALGLVETFAADTKHVSLAVDVDDEIIEGRAAAQKALKAIQKSASLSADVKKGVEILLSFGLLQTYGEDVKAYESLEDVVSCANVLSQPTASSSTSEAPLPPLDLLVDVLIAYLDKASNDLKSLASLVFGLVSSEVQPSTIEHLVAQLESSNEGYDSDEEMEEEEDDDADVASEDSSDDDAEDDDEDGDQQVDAEFRRRVAEALQVAGMANGDANVDGEHAEGSDDDEDDEEDSDDDAESVTESISMDDDQMLALDEKLASIFKERRTGKKGNNAVEALHFKQRVLDLVEIYLRKQQTNPLVLSFIPVLLALSQSSAPAEKSLAEKAKAILVRRFDKAVEVPTIVDVDAAKKTLEEIHNTARRTPSKEVGKACSSVSIFMAKAFNQSQASGAGSAVAEVYKASLKDFLTRKNSKLSPSFFQDYLQRQPLHAWALREDILGYAKGDAVNDFHYLSALNLLSAVAKQFSNVVKAGEKESVESYVEECRKVLYEALETKGSATGTWNAPRVKEVIKACLQMARLSQVVFDTPEKLAAAWSVEDLRNIELTLRQTERLAGTNSVFTLLSQLLLLVDPKAKESRAAQKQQKQADRKRKLDEVVAAPAVSAKKGKKAKTTGVDGEKSDAPPKKKKKVTTKKE